MLYVSLSAMMVLVGNDNLSIKPVPLILKVSPPGQVEKEN